MNNKLLLTLLVLLAAVITIGVVSASDVNDKFRLYFGANLGNLTDEDGGRFTFEAVWVPVEHTIELDLNRGQSSTEPHIHYPSGGDYPLSIKYTVETPDIVIPKPEMAGYTFTGWQGGWCTGLNTDVTVPSGTTENYRFIAHWAPITYDVTFSSTKGTPLNMPSRMTVPFDVYSSIPSNVPILDGYTFDGWLYDGHVYQPGADVHNLTDEAGHTFDFMAIWTPIPYEVTFDLNDTYGSTRAVAPEGSGFDYGETVSYNVESEVVAVPRPVREGYRFTGWSER